MTTEELQLRAYMIGPIEAVSDKEATDWRKEAAKKLKKMDIHVFDPTKKDTNGKLNEIGAEREYMNMLKSQGKWWEFYKRMSQIVHADLKCVDRSDFVIAYIPLNISMCGSINEIVVARQQKKKVFAFYDYGEDFDECQKKNLNSWLLWLIGPDYIFKTLDDVIDYIKTQDKREIIYSFKL